MPDATFAANLIGGYFETVQKERARKEGNALEAAKFLVSTGRVKDFNELVPFLGPMMDEKGGKSAGAGKGKKTDHASILSQFVNPAMQAQQPAAKVPIGSDQPATQPGRTGGPLFTEDEMQSRAEAAAAREREAGFSDFERRQKLTVEGKIEEDRAKLHRGVADKQATQDQDGKWTIKVRDLDGSVLYSQPANAPKATGALAERVKELVAQGVSEDRASLVASMQLQKERQTKQQQSAERTTAMLNMSRQSLAINTERYNEMLQTFPYTLAAKMGGAEAAQLRPELLRLAIQAKQSANPNDKALVDGQKEAAKIVEAASKQAKTLASKQSVILTGLGFDDDEATIRRNLIQEMSGGMDPDAVESMAKERVSGAGTPKNPPTTPPSTAQDRVEARKFLLSQKPPLLVTEANIQHYLDQKRKAQPVQ
jgi:hypothetical protein